MLGRNFRFTVLLVILAIAFGCFISRAFSQEKQDFKNVVFSSQDNFFSFFDQVNGKVFMYSEATGRLVATYAIDKLGQDLKKETERRSNTY